MSVTYQNGCNSLSDFPAVNGSGLSIAPNAGYVGSCLSIDFVGTDYVQQSVHVTLGQIVQVFQVYFKIPSTTILSTANDATIIAIYPTYQFHQNPAILQFRVQGLGAGFTTKVVDPSNDFDGDFDHPTVYAKDVFHRVVIERTASQWKVYMNKSPTPTHLYIPDKQPDTNFVFVSLGCDFNNDIDAIVGEVYFDQILAKNNNQVATFDHQLSDVYEGIQMRYFTADGAVVRPIDPDAGLFQPDIIAKAIGHALLHAVQNDDKANFDKIDNWTRVNLDRRNSTVANTVLNPAPTTALNLMSYLYYPNAVKPIRDANFNPDGDIERAFGLLLAAQKWVGSNLEIDTLEELANPNYLQRALNIIEDLRLYGFKYSVAKDANYILRDGLQASNVIETSPDYNYTAAYEDFAKVDDSEFWQMCIKGAYDLQDQMAFFVFTPQTSAVGLNGAYCEFDLDAGSIIVGNRTIASTLWGYESFRVVSRMLDHWNWYMDKRAIVSIQKPKPFLQNEWQKKGRIEVAYTHDGIGSTTFQATLFYAIYNIIFTINDQNSQIGKQIYNQKLYEGYQYAGNGSYFNEVGFFDDFWQGRIEAQRNCKWLKCNKQL